MAKRPFFTKSIFGNVEILAVIGIFSLYALQFAGFETFSALIPEESLAQFDLIGLDIGGLEISVNQGVFNLMAFTGAFIFIYFVFIRPQIMKRIKK